jgi:hypothetical protein
VSVPGVTVNGDRVVHRRFRGHGRGQSAAMIDNDGFDESGCACRGARVGGCRGRSALTTVVDDGRVGETGPAHRQGRTWSRGAARGASGVDGAVCGADEVDRAACGTCGVGGVARGAGRVDAGRVDRAARGAGRRASGGIEATCGMDEVDGAARECDEAA